MKMNELYGRLMETAIIVSEVFYTMLLKGELDEGRYMGEGEYDTYEELKNISENIEDILTSMDETERDTHGVEDIREWARERIIDAYGTRDVSVRQFSFDTTSSCTLPEIQTALDKAGIDVLGIEWKATWNSKNDYDKGVAPTSCN